MLAAGVVAVKIDVGAGCGRQVRGVAWDSGVRGAVYSEGKLGMAACLIG